MKAFVISLCSVGILISIIIFNSIYINNVTDNLTEAAEKLTIYDSEGLKEFSDYWYKHEHKICISTQHNDVDNVTITLTVLEEKCKNGDEDGFYEYKALLILYIDEIRKKEKVHFDNIL